MDQKTPLYDRHVALGGKIVPFGGFLLPVQYPTGIIAEHKAVRETAGLFDVSHMGEVILEGPDALQNLNHILTNRFDSLAIGGCRYAVMLYEDGGCVDDLIVYRRAETSYLIILNASNTEKDVAWLEKHVSGDAVLKNVSAFVGQIALQGPKAEDVLEKVADKAGFPTKYYSFVEPLSVAGVPCLVSRTGYTGEFGYEIYMKAEAAPVVWDALVNAGGVPCGLGARDTLRLEAAMPLYGHELSEHIDPLSAGLGFAVKMDKDTFIGKEALLAKGEPKRVRVGLQVVGRGIVREHQAVYQGDVCIGETSSGTMLPWVGAACAMAYVDADKSALDTPVEVDVRGRRVAAKIVEMPFYSRTRKK